MLKYFVFSGLFFGFSLQKIQASALVNRLDIEQLSKPYVEEDLNLGQQKPKTRKYYTHNPYHLDRPLSKIMPSLPIDEALCENSIELPVGHLPNVSILFVDLSTIPWVLKVLDVQERALKIVNPNTGLPYDSSSSGLLPVAVLHKSVMYGVFRPVYSGVEIIGYTPLLFQTPTDPQGCPFCIPENYESL